jgi:hypothetical protein
MKFHAFILVFVMATPFALAANPPVAKPATASVLPAEFGGWQASPIAHSADAAVADPANAALLKEYGFTDFSGATYTRNNNEKLIIHAARFADASGAYGAFTFYRSRPMQEEKIGERAAFMQNRVLFFRANILVDATFQQLTAMSAAELRELASDLPIPAGSAANLPSLPADLPQDGSISNTIKYVLGPIGLQAAAAPIPATLVNFGASAEVVLQNYENPNGESALTIVSYPTPQLAAQALRQLDAAHETLPAPIFDKRTGPLVVIASGPLSERQGNALLSKVNYEANVTWNENTYRSKKDNVGNLVVNVLLLCGIIGALCLVSGIAFGSIRLLAQRVLPGKVFDRPEDVEFISLHLEESNSKSSEKAVRRR